MAYRGVPAIVTLMPEYSVPHEAVIHVNGMVVMFTFLISVGTGILFFPGATGRIPVSAALCLRSLRQWGCCLATIGIYSVVSFVVTKRTHEFGIRMALGARTLDILRLVGGLTARLMSTGIVIGLAGAFALSRVIAEFVQGWDPKDPVAFLAVTMLMLGVGVAACWIPAQRAAAVEPMISLRHE